MVSTKDYKTRTIMMERNEKPENTSPDAWLIAMDIGYSAVKIYSQNSIAIFPSYAKPYTNKGTVGALPKDFITYEDLDTGEKWLVGRMAQEDITMDEAIDSDEALYGRQRYYDPMFKVIARVGLAMGMGITPERASEANGKTFYVQTGLPPRYKDDLETLKETLAGEHHFSIKIGSGNPVAYFFDLPKENIFVVQQPMGTLYSVCIDNNHNFIPDSKNYLAKNILIFDAGFGTFDLFFVKGHVVKDSQTFSNLGMKQVFLDTADAIKEKFGQNVSISEMQKYLESGKIRCFDRKALRTKEEPFADILEEAVNKVCSAAIEKMAQIYQLQDIDYLVITGGTGAAWKTSIQNRLSGMETMTIIDGNQNDKDLPFVFANVRGYYMYRSATMKLERISKAGRG